MRLNFNMARALLLLGDVEEQGWYMSELARWVADQLDHNDWLRSFKHGIPSYRG